MKDKFSTSLAADALDDYLKILLNSEELMACEEKKSAKTLSGSKLYHLDSHPARKNKSKEAAPADRHQFERVERLLEDFNRRQEVTEAEPEVLLQPPVLQPEIIEQEQPSESDQEVPEIEADIEESDEEVTESAAEQFELVIPEDISIEREDWSEDPFQTLLFNVAGLTLALPLIKLGGIHRIEKEITPLFGKPDWFLGLTPGIEGNINVIDTTRWVMPEKYKQIEAKGIDYKFIIILGDSRWGLACSDVQNAILLSPENIRWRTSVGKRPWLAGMLIEEMCALLDVDTLIKLLDDNFPR